MHFDLCPELTLPIATRKNLIGFVNPRNSGETGARSTPEGDTFTFKIHFPIPSISLGQGRPKSSVGALAVGLWRPVP